MVRRRDPPLWSHGNTDGSDHTHTRDAEVDHIHGDNGGVRATGGQMADGLCAVHAGSAADWKPVASEEHLHAESKLDASPVGYPRPTLDATPPPAGLDLPENCEARKCYCLASL